MFVNPEVEVVDATRISARETCASVYGFLALVGRPKAIRVSALNAQGEEETSEFSDWSARIVQHEVDHLQGRLFTDIMTPETLQFNYWSVVNKRRGDFKLGYAGISGFKHKIFPFNLIKPT